MRYWEIIREGYKEVQQKYVSAGIDPQSIEKTFNTYKSLVDRNQVSGNERNIDWWGKQSFDQFKAFVDEKSSEKSSTQAKRSKIPGKSINLVDNENWLIVIPLDKDASCFHGKNSDWCTTKQNQSHFEEYFYDRSIILIYCKNNNGGMWAIAAHTDTDQIEMFDQNDNSITKETFNSQTGLDVDKIVDEALKHQPAISSSRTPYQEVYTRINNYINSSIGRNAQIEKDLLFTKNGKLCMLYLVIAGDDEDCPLSIQLLAVKHRGRSIYLIKNPSEQVKLAAVTNNGTAIELIDDPSEAVQLAAVKQAAVTQDRRAIEWIIKKGITPSDAVKKAAGL